MSDIGAALVAHHHKDDVHMGNRSRLLLAGLTATLVLAAGLSAASASRLSVSEDDFEGIWQALRFSGGGSDITCPVTLLGTFHSRTMAKVSNALLGHVTHARIGGAVCTEGAATVLSETLPWLIQYNGFTGLLPNLSGVRLKLVGAALRVSDGVPCLFRMDTEEPGGVTASLNTTTGQVNSLRADEAFLIDLDDPGFLCELAGNGFFSGSTTKVSTLTGGLVFIDLI